jgi:hypothetical protein
MNAKDLLLPCFIVQTDLLFQQNEIEVRFLHCYWFEFSKSVLSSSHGSLLYSIFLSYSFILITGLPQYNAHFTDCCE